MPFLKSLRKTDADLCEAHYFAFNFATSFLTSLSPMTSDLGQFISKLLWRHPWSQKTECVAVITLTSTFQFHSALNYRTKSHMRTLFESQLLIVTKPFRSLS